ncbi:MAG: T9SS type A sorting domain-containing protein [Candidatus Krumholzibacteria bacterium]|nr:T9SS type A sorting domain-containing protein [Candidatus Krumholzibacteria bacterium]
MNKIISCCIALVLLLAGPASAQWTFEYQMESDIDFEGAHCPTGYIGYACGTGGSIYKTIDSGLTWFAQSTPVTDSFFDIFFIDATHGWAVGDNGVICYTADGTTWTQHAQSKVLATADYNVVHFSSATVGWLGNDDNVLYTTIDGGTTWTAAVTFADDVNGIAFANALTGYVALDGAGIQYTSDGGTTWNPASVNLGPFPYSRTDLEWIMAINDTAAVVTGWGSFVGAQPTIIATTLDGGATWTSNTDYHWATNGYGWCTAVFADEEVVLSGGSGGSAAFQLHSTDQGWTWTYEAPFTGEDINAMCVFPGTDRIVAVGNEGMLATSGDRGVTWSYKFEPGFGFGGFYALENYGSSILAGGDNAAYGYLEDGGSVRWSVAGANNMAPDIYDIQIVPAANAIDGYVSYVCGAYGSVYKSLDNGILWTELNHTFTTTDAMRGMHWFDADNGIIVGERASDDIIWVTSDGGATFTEIWYNILSQQFNAVSFARDNQLVGVVVGDNIGCYYTADGGVNWTASVMTGFPDAAADIEDVCMTTALVGYLVGDAGMFGKTTDGGVNWTYVSALATVKLSDVYFDHPGLGWIAGDDGAVYRSSDGGTTWADINAAVELGARDADCVIFNGTSGKLWIGGDYFDLLSNGSAAVTSADPISIPFVLKQNYPNPFNPSTTIKFSIGQKSFVALNVYDVTGRIVAKVVNKEMDAGDHTVSFQASGLASGVYFYRLDTGDEVQTKKMILLR